jgi:hypothetical protein
LANRGVVKSTMAAHNTVFFNIIKIPSFFARCESAAHLFKVNHSYTLHTLKTAFLENATRFYKVHVNLIIDGLIVKIGQKSAEISILFLK